MALLLLEVGDTGTISIHRWDYVHTYPSRTDDEMRALLDMYPSFEEKTYRARRKVEDREGVVPLEGNTRASVKAQINPGCSWKDIKDAQTICEWINRRLTRLDDLEAEYGLVPRKPDAAVDEQVKSKGEILMFCSSY